MCRIFACITDQPARLPGEVIAAQDRLLLSARDGAASGWGVAGYAAGQPYPALVRHLGASARLWGAHHFPEVDSFQASTWVTQVRRGSRGASSALNAQPFVFDQWAFVQVGDIPCYPRLRAGLELEIREHHGNCRLGDTDSELLFYWLLSQVEQVDPEFRATALEAAQSEMVQRARLCDHNVLPRFAWVLTDGVEMFASAWNRPLFHASGNSVARVMGHVSPDGQASSSVRRAAVANAPLPHGEWLAFPPRRVLQCSREQGLCFQRSVATAEFTARRPSSATRSV